MQNKRLIMRTVILAVLVFAIGFTMYTNFFNKTEIVTEGSVAPDFILTDLDGNQLQLSDYKGQGVFLNFWGTWCPPCKDEMPYMESQYNAFKDKGVHVIAVDADESKLAVEKFVKQYELTFPVVIDKGSEVIGSYNVGPLPTTFLINPNGIIVKKITGRMDEETIKKHMESVRPQ
jgi:peroxiredoxin